MPYTLISIGDFARATHLSVKSLRHYHRVGVLEPVDVDPGSGYRRYATEQVAAAQVIRRLRGLDMPLEDIRAVLTAPDLATRNAVIAGHLDRLEVTLQRTQAAAASLRGLLSAPPAQAPAELDHVSVPATPAATITDTIDIEDATAWYQGALGELHATLAAQGVADLAPAGGVFSDQLFSVDRGQATVFIPCDPDFRVTGRIQRAVIPATDLATTIHTGPPTDIDRAYGALATYVAQHALGIDGPIREYYLVDAHSDPDPAHWRTQVGWPIFPTSVPE